MPIGKTMFDTKLEELIEWQDLVAAKGWWARLLNRIHTAGGPYEMLGGSLLDGVVFHTAGKGASSDSLTYYEDMPHDMFHQRFKAEPRLTFAFHFGYHGTRLAMAPLPGRTALPRQIEPLDPRYGSTPCVPSTASVWRSLHAGPVGSRGAGARRRRAWSRC
jgi:hypothetical protein